MTNDAEQPGRRSIRLRGYDYSQAGLYFLTICAWKRQCLLGAIKNGEMLRNELGEIVWRVRHSLPARFASVSLDECVAMPNHLHGIIVLVKAGIAPPRGAASSAPTPQALALGRIVRAFKSLSAAEVNRKLGRSGVPVWQRNYYEHIIRRGEDLDDGRRYIAENATRWAEDPENPAAQTTVYGRCSVRPFLLADGETRAAPSARCKPADLSTASTHARKRGTSCSLC